jgi:hypothetical protein
MFIKNDGKIALADKAIMLESTESLPTQKRNNRLHHTCVISFILGFFASNAFANDTALSNKVTQSI